MAAHEKRSNPAHDRLELGEMSRPLFRTAVAAAVIGLGTSIVMMIAASRTFFFAYLAMYCFFLSIALGSLFFVLVTHLTRAGWSVSVRRVAECIAVTIPVLGLLSLPVLISVTQEDGDLYRWALPLSAAARGDEHAEAELAPVATEGVKSEASAPQKRVLDRITLAKRAWLNPAFFVTRIVIYFAAWSIIAVYFWQQSTEQDKTGDFKITEDLQAAAGPCMVVLGLTLTGAAYDLIMSLDPHWYSTIFGGYFFAGSAVSFWAVLILTTNVLQENGWLKSSLTVDHFHDMGKYLFAFTFFWGYIAFSQYMLLWYASIPEEVAWYSRHGATTVSKDMSGWTAVVLALLFGQFLIPFAGLMSRHVKRNRKALIFWAVWILVFHMVDMCWLVLPEFGPGLSPALAAVAALVSLLGIGGVVLVSWVMIAGTNPLRPLRDPRLEESLAFQELF